MELFCRGFAGGQFGGIHKRGLSVPELSLESHLVAFEADDFKEFDRVARRWNVDYAFYKNGEGKYLLFFKSKQADAITACFGEYSRRIMDRPRARRVPILERMKRAGELLRQFREKHEATQCAELLSRSKDRGIARKEHCDGLVLEMVETLEQILSAQGE